MPTTPPFPIAMGQRTLAAIVFTDVVGYSARMQKEETGTLELLENDFTTMKEFSDGLSGAVLKSTGDGLLIYFSSAVNAVTWAVKTQRHFAERARTELLTKILRHRIGVHVGDVFRTEDDVVGDGVNIAARVQSEAPTGGVCISQTAYDMVKNKMELHVARLSSRQLKNIAEPVPIYQVLLDGPELVLRNFADNMPSLGDTKLDPAARRRRILAGVSTLVVLAGGGFTAFGIYRSHNEQIAQSHAMQAELDRALTDEDRPSSATDVRVTFTKSNAPPAVAPPAGPDFARMTGARPPDPTKTDRALLAQADAGVAALEQWVQAQLLLYSRDHQLLVRDLDGGLREWAVYTDTDHRLCLAQGGAALKKAWPDVTIDKQAAIIVSALGHAAAPVSSQISRGAEAFAYLHGLPDMAGALIRSRIAGGTPQ